MSRKYKTMEVLNSMQSDITRQKSILKTFQSDYNNLVKKYLTDFNDIEFLELFNTLNDLEESIVQSANKLTGKKEEVKQEAESANTDNSSEV